MKIPNNYLSKSKIEMFEQCPMRYFLIYEKEIPHSDTFATKQGTIIHEVLEEYAKGQNKDWKKNLINKYFMERPWQLKKDWQDNTKSCGSCPYKTVVELEDLSINITCNLTGEDTRNMLGCPREETHDAEKMISTIINDPNSPIHKKVIDTEKQFSLQIGEKQVNGFIDLIVEHDENTIEVVDYKTGKAKSYEEACNDLQLTIYYAASKQLYPQYKHCMLTLYFLKHGALTVVFSDEHLRELNKYIPHVYSKIEAETKPMPLAVMSNRNYWLCRFCNIEECDKECKKIHGKTYEQFKNSAWRK